MSPLILCLFWLLASAFVVNGQHGELIARDTGSSQPVTSESLVQSIRDILTKLHNEECTDNELAGNATKIKNMLSAYFSNATKEKVPQDEVTNELILVADQHFYLLVKSKDGPRPGNFRAGSLADALGLLWTLNNRADYLIGAGFSPLNTLTAAYQDTIVIYWFALSRGCKTTPCNIQWKQYYI